jgi:hypothetical protein
MDGGCAIWKTSRFFAARIALCGKTIQELLIAPAFGRATMSRHNI